MAWLIYSFEQGGDETLRGFEIGDITEPYAYLCISFFNVSNLGLLEKN